MNRQQKEQVVDFLREKFSSSPTAFVVGVQGLTVAQFQILRKDIRSKGGSINVAKVRLAKRSLGQLPEEQKVLAPLFKQQLAFIFSDKEGSTVAKSLYQFAKTNEAFKLVCGYCDNVFLSVQEIETLAVLPSRDELLAMVARVLNEPMAGLARVIQALAEKKEQETEK
jgi:large subunit ribosomal protein L10